jgi:5-methylcytosine-specific restriction endonuclease McrA
MQLYNKEVSIQRYSDFYHYHVQIPNEQRILDVDKCNEIVEYQLQHIKLTSHCNFLGVINVHFCKEDSIYYVVDGQHRLTAIRRLYQEFSHDVYFMMEIVTVNTRQELKHNYNLINKNTPLPDFPEDIDKTIPELVTLYFKNKYPGIWTSKTRRPFLHLNHFQESIARLHLPYNEMIECIETYNRRDMLWKGVTDNMFKKADEHQCYLGLYSKTDDVYDWIKLILHEPLPTRQKIPKKVKDDAWDIHIGSTLGEVYCIVCDATRINSKHFDAGHIQSNAYGGTSSIENILPICRPCNLSMGKTHMETFIATNYPANLRSFQQRQYRT